MYSTLVCFNVKEWHAGTGLKPADSVWVKTRLRNKRCIDKATRDKVRKCYGFEIEITARANQFKY